MDIQHPSKVKPDPSSKPIIVTNRPMIAADPMIAKAAEAALVGHVEQVEVTEEPTPISSENPPSAPAIVHREKIILPISEQISEPEEQNIENVIVTKNEESLESEKSLATPELPDSDVETSTAAVVEQKIESEELVSPQDASDTEESVSLQAKKAPEHSIEIFTKEDLQKASGAYGNDTRVEIGEDDAKNIDFKTTPSVQTDENKKIDTKADDTISSKNTSPTKSTPKFSRFDDNDLQIDALTRDEKEKTDEEKRSDDIELIIAKGTFVLPINQSGKRKERIIIGTLLIVLLLALMLDVLLDIGVVSLPWLPHTTFFSL